MAATLHPEAHGRFIGRVGALAVALGIGVALANSPGIAWADDGPSSSSSESSNAAGSSEKAEKTKPSKGPKRASKPSTTSAERKAGVEKKPEVRRGKLVSDALSALGRPDKATRSPVPKPPPSPASWAMAAFARREIGHTADRPAASKVQPATTVAAQTVSTTMDSPLGTPEQLEAERTAAETVKTLPVRLMKGVLKVGFAVAAYQQFPNGPDRENLDALDDAVDEFALAAAFQQQLLNPMEPKFVTQVAPPHTWYGQSVGGTRILYDNPDTIYRFTSVSATSEYVIKGQFHDMDGDGDLDIPADTSFSVLEGVGGTTSKVLVVDDRFEMDEDGRFEITVSSEPTGGPNHLQLTPGSTIIASRNTLGDWNEEQPMSLSIERVGGPPNSLAAQLGLFTFLGSVFSENPALTNLVSIVPPTPYLPPVVRGTFTALILVVRGVQEQSKYMALATDAGEPNVVGQPSSNAEFLANQLQSNGYYELADDEALVITIDPGDAGYFVVPVYNDWTITDNYWDQPTSLNNEQAKKNADGTYTVVISPTDPGAANWISTGGMNQGLISMRFQNIGGDPNNAPRIVDQQVMTHSELQSFLPPEDFVTPAEREAQLAKRKAGFDNRWAPYPQV